MKNNIYKILYYFIIMNIKNVLIGSGLFVVYNICSLLYIKNERKKKNYKLKFELHHIKL